MTLLLSLLYVARSNPPRPYDATFLRALFPTIAILLTPTIYVRLAVREDWMKFSIVPLSVVCMQVSSYPSLVSRLYKSKRFLKYKSQIYNRLKEPTMTRVPTISVSWKKTATSHLTFTQTSLQASNDTISYMLNPRLLLNTTLDII